VVRDVLNVISAKASEKGLELIVSNLEFFNFYLVGDELRLRQVLINLANNTIKFTQTGYVEIEFEKLSQTDKIIEFRISIIDTGIGLSESDCRTIFQPFTQADMSTTRKFGGTGLGLSLSRRLVHLMGGEITVESEVAVGSRFKFDVKLGLSTENDSSYFRDKPLLKNLNVLVIEDNHETLVVLLRMLESFGITTTPYLATTITEQQLVVSNMDFSKYDLIMLDSTLSTCSFIDIACFIKSRFKQDATHLLLMSEISTNMDDVNLQFFDSIIEKPITPSELYDGLITSIDIRSPSTTDYSISDDERNRLLAKLASKHVLVVEDNLINQQVARELIGAFGIHVECANNGQEAIELIKETKFDMIFMDMQMPVLDGIETTQIIRQEKLIGDTPIVAMTANAMAGDREICINAGMDDYISKPIKPEILYECLQHWLLRNDEQSETKLRELMQLLISSSMQSEDSSAEIKQVSAETRFSQEQNIERINRAFALSSLDNNIELYTEILSMFYETYQTNVMQGILFESPAEDPKRKLHTLKGLAATIGATSLNQVIAELESDQQDLSSNNPLFVSCLSELELVCLEIKNKLNI